MTDPVREEMKEILHKFHCKGMSYEYEDYCTDLLRVIRGHTRIRFSRMSYFCCGNFRICDKELQHTLESLPEEVKKSGKSE